MKRTWLWGAAVAAVAIVAGGTAWQHFAPMRQAKDAVRGELNDPASAQFRNVTQPAEGTVCGQVNARNRLGGYVGFRSFFVLDGIVFLEPGDQDPLHALFMEQYAGACDQN